MRLNKLNHFFFNWYDRHDAINETTLAFSLACSFPSSGNDVRKIVSFAKLRYRSRAPFYIELFLISNNLCCENSRISYSREPQIVTGSIKKQKWYKSRLEHCEHNRAQINKNWKKCYPFLKIFWNPCFFVSERPNFPSFVHLTFWDFFMLKCGSWQNGDSIKNHAGTKKNK